jgi:hypothetical protein
MSTEVPFFGTDVLSINLAARNEYNIGKPSTCHTDRILAKELSVKLSVKRQFYDSKIKHDVLQLYLLHVCFQCNGSISSCTKLRLLGYPYPCVFPYVQELFSNASKN